MNGYNTNDYIGGLGEYYLINYITNVSNLLENHIKTNISNNYLIHTDTNSNTIIYSSNEIQFSNVSNFKTKIDNSGFLRVWYDFNISTPSISSQWLSVVDSLGYFYNQDTNNQIQFTALNNDIAGLGTTLGTTTTTANSALALATTANATASTALGNGITNSAQISSINQTLPTLISSNSLSNILNTCNYLPKSGGTLTGTLTSPNIINSTSFIYQGTELTTTLTNYMLKAGATMTGRLNFNYALFGDPSPSGIGDRVVLNLGIGTTGYASSIGINTNSFWFSAPTSTNYNWYINGSNILSLNSNNLNFANGNINCSNIQQGGIDMKTVAQNTILNNTPNVSKKYGFTATCSTSIIMPDANTYYKYDINLTNYTQLKYIANPNTPYRIFNIKIFLASAYFEYSTTTIPNILSYEIYMSNESQNGGGGGYAGINICALGVPQNYSLNSILPTTLSLLRTGDFNYLSIISRSSGALCNVIIEDLLF